MSKKRCPVMAVDLGDSEIQLMKAYDDLAPIIIKTEMTGNLAFLSSIIPVILGLIMIFIFIGILVAYTQFNSILYSSCTA